MRLAGVLSEKPLAYSFKTKTCGLGRFLREHTRRGALLFSKKAPLFLTTEKFLIENILRSKKLVFYDIII